MLRASADRQPSDARACFIERLACQAKRGQCRQWFSRKPVIETYLEPSPMRASLAGFPTRGSLFLKHLALGRIGVQRDGACRVAVLRQDVGGDGPVLVRLQRAGTPGIFECSKPYRSVSGLPPQCWTKVSTFSAGPAAPVRSGR